MKKHYLAIVIIIFSAMGAVNRDSLQTAIAESLQTKLFRGEILVHFPLVIFQTDSALGDAKWFPIPEMGFRFTPILAFKGGWFAFPFRVTGMFPFTDDYAALGDASIGCEVNVPPYHAGLSYRYLRGKIYPIKGEAYAHIAEVDLGIPVQGLQGTGVAINWIIYTKIEIGTTITSTGRNIKWDYYDGNALTLSPYWKFSPGGYGEITLSYRFPILQNFTGYDSDLGGSYIVNKSDFSMIEFRYVFP